MQTYKLRIGDRSDKPTWAHLYLGRDVYLVLYCHVTNYPQFWQIKTINIILQFLWVIN